MAVPSASEGIISQIEGVNELLGSSGNLLDSTTQNEMIEATCESIISQMRNLPHIAVTESAAIYRAISASAFPPDKRTLLAQQVAQGTMRAVLIPPFPCPLPLSPFLLPVPFLLQIPHLHSPFTIPAHFHVRFRRRPSPSRHPLRMSYLLPLIPPHSIMLSLFPPVLSHLKSSRLPHSPSQHYPSLRSSGGRGMF